LKFYLKHASL
jgi:hypothetical protein